MPFINPQTEFLPDKNLFFSNIKSNPTPAYAQQLAKQKNYTFTINNHGIIESEFRDLFAALNKSQHKKQEQWLYCYYCASLLESFHNTYDQKSEAARFTKHRQFIEQQLSGKERTSNEAQQSYLSKMYAEFKQSLMTLVTAPAHSSSLRNYVAMTNMYRLLWVFTRLTISQGLLAAASMEWLEKLKADAIIEALNMPSGVLSYFSVGLFLARFMIDASVLVKHTFFPDVIENHTHWYERLGFELNKRYGRMVNDAVWGTVNFLTNFNHISGIPGPITGYITAGFLVFDVSWILIQLAVGYKNYKLKLEQYENELKSDRSEIVKLQMDELKIQWETQKATALFCAAAATMLLIGFTTALIANPAIIGAVCFFAGTLAVAMYLSSGAYGEYVKKGLYLEAQPVDRVQAQKDYEIARNEFFFSLFKHTAMPLLIVTTFAVCWPAAVVLTAMYIGMELAHSYSQYAISQPQESKPEPESEYLTIA